MTLTDTGPVVALINRNDPNHPKCIEAAKSLPHGPLITTWPCFTEAMYLLHKGGGYPAQAALWQLRDAGRLTLHDVGDDEMVRMAAWMLKYQDLPMDLADASLMAAAEKFNTRLMFTLDRDFRVYRFANGDAVEVVP
ncbi:MAG: type II toxin-antitoxin system VapC family toxin [Pirellulaceae bacterium]